MIYVDDMRMPAEVPNGRRIVTGRWSHLMGDSTTELVAFGRRIRLREAWLQHPGRIEEHFDVTDPKRVEAVRAGAIEISFVDDLPALLQARRAARAAHAHFTTSLAGGTWSATVTRDGQSHTAAGATLAGAIGALFALSQGVTAAETRADSARPVQHADT